MQLRPRVKDQNITSVLKATKATRITKKVTTAATKKEVFSDSVAVKSEPRSIPTIAAIKAEPARPGSSSFAKEEPNEHPLVASSPLPRPGSTYLPPLTHASCLPQAYAHLTKIDPRFAQLIEAYPCRPFTDAALREQIDPFRTLVTGVLSQQVSGAAAKSIGRKFVALFLGQGEEGAEEGFFPTPGQVVEKDIPTLQTAGLSQRKAEYVLDIATRFVDGRLSPSILANGTDEEVVKTLTAVRGLGVWSAEMFLMFALKRTDVLSTGDLGIQRGMAAWTGRNVKGVKNTGKWKYMAEKDMVRYAEQFRPYRSIMSWYMWRADGTVLALGEEVKKQEEVQVNEENVEDVEEGVRVASSL
ncbi:3-methyladenine DNA glycosylase [Saitoella coloradoensis]